MQRHDFRRTVGVVATAAIGCHLVATTLFNTPDSFNLDLRRYVGGWPIPGWRFFAPNPGTQNVHLLVRTRRSRDPEGLSQWNDITPTIHHGRLSALINPRSRGPKALFDALQQLTVMKINHSEPEWIRRSTPYELVLDAALGLHRVHPECEIQILLVNYFPAAPHDARMQPVLISDWERPSGDDSRG